MVVMYGAMISKAALMKKGAKSSEPEDLLLFKRFNSLRISIHQTDESSFYLSCGYKGVGVYFVQRHVALNMTEKN